MFLSRIVSESTISFALSLLLAGCGTASLPTSADNDDELQNSEVTLSPGGESIFYPDSDMSVVSQRPDGLFSMIELSDGRIVTGGYETVEIWGPNNPNEVLATYLGHTDTVFALLELSDGRVASAGTDKTVQIWDPANPSAAIATYLGHGLDIWSIIELSDGRIASASADRTVQIWDPSSPDLTIATYSGHSEQVRDLVELKDGRIASASWDGTVHIWDSGTLMTEAVYQSGLQVNELIELSTGHLASASLETTEPDYTGTVRILDVADTDNVVAAYVGHDSSVNTLSELPDGRVVSGGADQVVHIWDPENPGVAHVIYSGHENRVSLVVPLSDGRIASAILGGPVHIWEPAA